MPEELRDFIRKRVREDLENDRTPSLITHDRAFRQSPKWFFCISGTPSPYA